MGALNILAKTAKAANEADKALPLRLARAAPKSQAEIDALATRVSKQMLGEHVGSGKPKDTTNLAGRSRKENERVKGLDYEVTPTGAAKESVIYQPRKGDVNVAIPGDQTISDSILRRVGDIEGIDSHQQGGARYGLGKMHEEDPLFWASGEGPAQMAQNKFGRVADFYDPERVVGQHLAMGPVSNNFAMHFADANLRAMDYSKIKPKDMQAFDRLIANGYVKKNQKTGQMEHINFPEWPGIADPDAAMEVMKSNPELRKWFNDRMKTPKVTQPLGLPNGLDIQWAITEPQLRNMEVNLTGLSAGEMVPGASLTDTAAHNTYEKGIRGKALGHQEVLTPFTLSYPDAAQHIASTQRPQDFTGTIQKVFPHQMVDDQWLDEVAKYRELIKKYTGQKSGGEIHMSNFEKRLRGIKDEEGKDAMRKIMALMAGMIKGQPTDIASQTFKGRDYKTKKNPNPTSPSMPSFAFKGKQYAEGGDANDSPIKISPFANKQHMNGADISNAGLMANADLKEAGRLSGGVNLTSIEKDRERRQMEALLANYSNNIGDVGINAGVVKPLDKFIPSDLYQTNLVGSVPIGDGRLSAGMHGTHVDGQHKVTGHSLGYNAPVGGGRLNVNINKPKEGKPMFGAQWQRHFAEGGATDSQPTRFRLPKFRRGGGSQKGKDKPMYEAFTQGLGPMLFGAARGTAAGLAGAPGDIEELGRMGINYVGEKAGKPNLVNEESALPTSERVLKKIPSLKDLGAGKAAQHSEDFGSNMGMYGVSQIVAPKAGTTLAKGAKTLGKEMGELAGHKIATGQPLIPGIPASITNPPVMNIIKPEGGNWRGANKSVENRLNPYKESSGYDKPEKIRGNPQKVYEDKIASIDSVIERMKQAGQWDANAETQYANLKRQALENYAIDKWIDSNLGNYMKKQMGTESDPIRKLADEGITHYADLGAMRTDLNSGYNQYARNKTMRKKLGVPENPLAETNLGKTWEEGVDDLIGSETQLLSKYGTEARRKKNPWMNTLPEDTPFYGIPGRGINTNLGFDHIIDVLRQDVRSGRIHPNQLNKVSIKQAVERTSEYNADMAKKMAETKLQQQDGFPVHKEYPEGYRWIELSMPQDKVLPEGYSIVKNKGVDLDSDDAYLLKDGTGKVIGFGGSEAEIIRGLSNTNTSEGYKKLRDALDYEGKTMGHCVGSYCDEVSGGNTKIYSLRDKNGEPHVTIEVNKDYDAPSFYETNKKLFEDPRFKEAQEMWNDYADSPEQYVSELTKLFKEAGLKEGKDYVVPTQPNPIISQIKGKQNRAPNPEYLPYVQDFVKSSQWGDEIGDFHNTGLKTLDQAFPNYEDAKRYGRTNPDTRYVTQADIDAYHKQVNEELLNEYSKYRLKPDPESKNTLGRNDLMTIRELAELEFPGDLQKQANMIRGAMQGTTEPGAYSGSIFPPLEEKKGGAISIPKFTLKMGVGGFLKNAIKGAKGAQKIEAPKVIIPGDINRVKEAIRQSHGEYGAKRVERAADEIPNLEKLYQEEALRSAFGGDNAKALMTMNPKDFEKYATPIPKSADEPMQYRGYGSQYLNDKMKDMSLSEYIDNLVGVKGGFADVPFLLINKEEQGLPLVPFISGHEGRHRNRAMAKKGVDKGLIELLPRAELREPFPRRSQEEYIEALKKELEMTDNMVEPQIYQESGTDSFLDNLNKTDSKIRRPAIKLPDIYAKGGLTNTRKKYA
jgi:hypothetical protein